MCKNEEEQLDNNFELKKNTSDKTLVFLNSKNVNEFLNYKDSILKKLLITKFDFQVIFSSGNENNSTTSSEAFDLKIERSLKIDKIFKMETTIKMPPKLLKEKFIKCYSKTNKYLLHSQIL